MRKLLKKIAIISVGIIGIFLLFSSANLSAQNVAVTDDETYTADPSAMLDVKSDSKGLLIPRLTTTQRNGISNPAHGLLVYDSDEKVFYYFDGSSWVNLSLGQAWEINSNYVYLSSDNGRVGIGTSTPNSKLEVKADNTFTENDTLFAVKDQNGNIVFAVFPDGAKVYVNSGTKGKIGGFAVSGRTSTKAEETEYLRVTADSTRIYVNEDATKGKIGGFAVSGRTSTKGLVNDYLLVGSDSTRIYVKEDATKGKIGGFAVSGRTSTKGLTNDYLFVTNDSTRIYVNEDATKGKLGGFAVSGRTSTKGLTNDYLFVTNDSTRIYVNEDATEGKLGGFAVSGRTNTKGATQKFMDMTKENYFIGHLAGINTTPGLDSLGKYNSFIGYESGRTNITGRFNTFMGYQTGWNNTGSDNTFIGYKAGKSHLEKGGNVYIGSKAGENATQGEQNVYIGEFSGWNTSIGKQNIFMGVNSGYNNTSGSQNIFLGVDAGNTNQEGNYNVFMGYQAGLTNNADYNTFIGYQSGLKNTMGQNNVFLGYHAGRDNTLGKYNVFLGYRAGLNNIGDGTFQGAFNVFIGHEAGMANKIGQSNVYIGHSTSKIDTSGRYNVNIGRSAGVKLKDAHFNVLLGAQAAEWKPSGGNNVMIGKSAGARNEAGAYNVIIGNQAGNNMNGDIFGSHQLSYNVLIGSYAAISGIGSENVVIGSNAGRYLKVDTSDNNVIIGNSAGYNAIGSKNVFIGNQAGYSEQGSERLYIENASGLPENALIYGEFDNDILRLNGNVGIGKDPTENFDVNGKTKTTNFQMTSGATDGYVLKSDASGNATWSELDDNDWTISGSNLYYNNGNVGIGSKSPDEKLTVYNGTSTGTYTKSGWQHSSDKRLKDNIKPISSSLNNLIKLQGVYFNWKNNPDERQVGLIAQDVESIIPEVVSKNNDGYYSISYGNLSPVIIEAIKEQQEIIDNQKEKIINLEERLSQLEDLMLNK